MNNTAYRFHVISRHGLEGTLCSNTRAKAFAAAESLATGSWPVAVYDSMAHQGKPHTWNLLPGMAWRAERRAPKPPDWNRI